MTDDRRGEGGGMGETIERRLLTLMLSDDLREI